ncbi:MAG TPA: ATP-binding protein [Streptosporangiaceae bacterium]|nr:ATP-binding protein [Streptosporangiaceae bacterium]
MTGDAFLSQPAAGAGRASQASAPPPVLDQGFDSGTLYRLRAAVQAHADHAGLSEDRANDVVLAVHELAANAIAHGAGHGRLRLWDLNGSLTCEIVDSGRPGTSASADSADPWPAADGHGLWLVGQVADHLDLRSGPRGTRAVITFALPLRAVRPPIDNPGPPRGSEPGLGG